MNGLIILTTRCDRNRYVLPFDSFFSYYVPFMAKMQYGFLNIREGDTVIDAGAFPGDFTLYASRLVGASGRVIAIEPHPYNFKILKANIRLNDLRNVIPVNKALSDHEGRAMLSGIGVDAHISDSGIEVETTTLDNIALELGLDRVDVVKMDIEGQEVAALRGFQGLEKVREVAIEVHGVSSYKIVADHLVERGFRVHILDNLLLAKNIIRHVAPCLSDFIIAELRSGFLASRLLLKYMLGFEDHPAPACRSHGSRIIYGVKEP